MGFEAVVRVLWRYRDTLETILIKNAKWLSF